MAEGLFFPSFHRFPTCGRLRVRIMANNSSTVYASQHSASSFPFRPCCRLISLGANDGDVRSNTVSVDDDGVVGWYDDDASALARLC